MTIAVEAGSNPTPISQQNSVAASIATVNPADIIILAGCMKAASKKINSISDTAGLNWQRLLLYNATDPSLDVWWAPAPSAMNGANVDSITVTLSSYIVVGNVDVIGISGANYSTPFDANANSLLSANGVNSIPTVTGFSTSNANDMILGISEINANVAGTIGSGYTIIDTNIATGVQSGTTNYNSLASEEQIFSSNQTAVSVAFGTGSGVGVNWSMIALALQQGATSPTGIPQALFHRTPNPGFALYDQQIKRSALINYTNSMATPIVPGLISKGFEYIQGRIYSSAPGALFKNYIDTTTSTALIDSAIGMASPIVPGLISNGAEYLRGNVYSSRQEAIDYAVLLYPVGFPLSLIVQAPAIQSGPAVGVMVTSAYNHIQYNEVLAYLQEFQKDLPRNLTVQPPLAQPLAIGPYFPGIAGTYGMSSSELGYLAETGKTLPKNLIVQAPLISVIPPPPPPNTQILTGAQYGLHPEILGSLTLVPVDYPYTIQPPFIIGQASVGVIEAPSMYGSDHAEIQGFLQDYQLKFPRNLTINPVNVILPNALTKIMPKFQFGSMPEILAFLELRKQQYPRPQNTEPYVSLNPVIGNSPILITDTEVVKGGSNVFVVKGNATAYVIVI